MKELLDLPIYDICPIIFNNLSIEDLFNCRLVNKQFKYFSDHTNGINKLIIGQPYLKNKHYTLWYHNNKLIEEKEIISLECFRSIKLLSIFNLDKKLKYLKVCDNQLKLEELSNLINLEYLEFGYDYHPYQQVINLNNLKFLSSDYQPVELNTPKLEKIQFNHINKIQFNSNPESIKHLVTRNYDNGLEIFNNLEIMELRDADESINENLLIIFKYLKQLKINLILEEVDYSNEEIMNSLIKIFDDKIKLGREIDIYLEGVKIENIDKFNELKDSDSEWEFRLNNYDQLDLNLSSIQCLEYHELEKWFNNIKNDLPSSFFDKFQYIYYVYLNKADDVDGLNWFLNNLKQLTSLTIDFRVLLDEIFCNNLPDTIRFLYVDDGRDFDNKRDIDNINFDIILKSLKSSKLILIWFTTEVDKDLFDLAFKSFLNLKYLKEFVFNFNSRHIVIVKNGKHFYLNDSDEKLDYNQLIVECNKIRSK